MNRIFILGHTGYIGSYFVKYFHENKVKFHPLFRGDISNLQCILRKNDILINCAGYTGKPNVDACEDNKVECLEGNVILPGKLNEICIKTGAILCHISSGCIYNGFEKDYIENDIPNFSFRTNNCSFYSGTKALGEEIIKNNPNCYILRLRIPFNQDLDNSRNYLSKLIYYPKLINILNSITNIDEFINCAYKIISQNHSKGIYHIVNPKPLTTKQIVEDFLIKYNIIQKKEFFDTYEDFSKIIKTTRSNCILNTSKIEKIGLKLKDTYDSIEEAIIKYKKII